MDSVIKTPKILEKYKIRLLYLLVIIIQYFMNTSFCPVSKYLYTYIVNIMRNICCLLKSLEKYCQMFKNKRNITLY